MKALVYKGVGQVQLEDRPRPELSHPSDAIVKVTKTTICGTDLHIRKSDVSTCAPGRILGHEGVGVIESTGASVVGFSPGDRVMIPSICSCATCEYCRRGMYSHCTTGGWVLGRTIDGVQAEYVRIPHAASSLYRIPPGMDDSAAVMLSDTLPTGLECGVINGKVQPGSTVAIVGPGPIGLATLMTARMYSPSLIVVVGRDVNRLKVASELGAHYTVYPRNALEMIMSLTGGKGCDTVIEAVGTPTTFELCQKLLAPGGTLANVGVRGFKADLFLDELWEKNISITTKLLDTTSTPILLKLVQSGKLDPSKLITHNFKFDDVEQAYETFATASKHKALKVLIEM